MRRMVPIFCTLLLAVGCNPQAQTKSEPTPPASAAAPAAAPTAVAAPDLSLLTPSRAAEKAPAVFKVRFSTTKGGFLVEVHRDWAPQGADRFYNLVKMGYFTDTAFFRAIEGFMVQFGLHGSPDINSQWREARIPDDPAVGQSNRRGYVTFATAGPNTRTTQLFINYGDNGNLDGMGFTPFGKVVEGMDTVDKLYKGYGEGAPSGMGPNQGRIHMEGNAYLKRDFPLLDYIQSARIAD